MLKKLNKNLNKYILIFFLNSNHSTEKIKRLGWNFLYSSSISCWGHNKSGCPCPPKTTTLQTHQNWPTVDSENRRSMKKLTFMTRWKIHLGSMDEIGRCCIWNFFIDCQFPESTLGQFWWVYDVFLMEKMLHGD